MRALLIKYFGNQIYYAVKLMNGLVRIRFLLFALILGVASYFLFQYLEELTRPPFMQTTNITSGLVGFAG